MSTTPNGSSSSNGNMKEDTLVWNIEGKVINPIELSESISWTLLYVVEVSYQDIQMASVDLDQNIPLMEEYDLVTLPL